VPAPRLLALLVLLPLAVAAGAGHPRRAGAQEVGPAAVDGRTAGGTLVVGRVSGNPRKDYAPLKALADYLAAELASVGIARASVQFADDAERMAGLLREGAVDLVFDTAFPAVMYEEQAGAKLLLREWRDGAASYQGILFKRKDTPIAGLPDLVGRSVAFERPGSTTAFFVPRAELVAAGLQPRELAGPDQQPRPGEVGYVFAGSENNIVVWVHRGVVAAGAFSDIDWDQAEDMPPALKQDLEIFHRSAPLARALVVARHDLPPPLEQRVKAVLLAAHADPAGGAALKARKISLYDELEGEAAASVEAVRRLVALGQ
jgi:phosphonate transport system substrate-binding protein